MNGCTALTTSPVPLLFNPTAGRGRAGRLATAVSDLLASNGVANTPQASRAVGDIEELTANAIREGRRRIIVVGGDGSIHEAVNGILNSDPETELGVIPIGTGNDFAKASTIPMHWEHAAPLLADRLSSDSPARVIDAGRCNGRYFANSAGIGFDANVSAIARSIKLPIGDAAYLIAVFRAMLNDIVTPKLRMTFGGEQIESELTLASFSNGPWVGGMFLIAPDAQNDDGLLDLVYADPVSRMRIVTLLPKIFKGSHIAEPEVHSHRLRKCTIVADTPVLSHLDGEIQAPQTHFDIELLAGVLRLL